MTIYLREPTLCEHASFGDVKIGNIVNVDGVPFKIVEYTTCKAGKHGVCKVNMTCIDIFFGKKKELMDSSTASIESVEVKRYIYLLTNIGETENDEDQSQYLSLMDNKNKVIEHFKLPKNELGNKIQTLFEKGEQVKITTTHALDKEMITGCEIE